MVRMHSDVKKFKWKQYYFEEKFHGIIDKVEKILEGSLDLDPITFTFSENSNYGRDTLLEV